MTYRKYALHPKDKLVLKKDAISQNKLKLLLDLDHFSQYIYRLPCGPQSCPSEIMTVPPTTTVVGQPLTSKPS